MKVDMGHTFLFPETWGWRKGREKAVTLYARANFCCLCVCGDGTLPHLRSQVETAIWQLSCPIPLCSPLLFSVPSPLRHAWMQGGRDAARQHLDREALTKVYWVSGKPQALLGFCRSFDQALFTAICNCSEDRECLVSLAPGKK